MAFAGYIDLAAAIPKSIKLATGNVSVGDIEQNIHDEWASELLEMSAGTAEGDIIHYQVFMTAATLMQVDRDDHALIKAEEGVEFTEYSVPIARLLQLQIAYNKGMGLVVPDGWDPAIALNQLCACKGGTYAGAADASALPLVMSVQVV
jgi:hypothetical protein